MTEQSVAALGECMVEIRLARGGEAFAAPVLDAAMGFGGDTLNFALYLARLGQPVEYVTALGDDVLSGWLLEQWRKEGVGSRHVLQIAGAVPGLYLVTTDEQGERSFTYWREQAPVRRMLDDPVQAEQVFDALLGFDLLYLSGITLALFPPPARERLLKFLARRRERGARNVFDNNYRPRLWPKPAEARAAFDAIFEVCDLALASAHDQRALYGNAGDLEIIEHLQARGVSEVVLKLGSEGGCMVACEGRVEAVASVQPARVVDTTAAGDSFNAGYLAARIKGRGGAEAAAAGSRLAAHVVQHPGAITPRDAMTADCEGDD